MCKNWKQAGQLVPRLKAGMRWGLGHKEVKSGLPPCPEHVVPLALSSVGEAHSSSVQPSAFVENPATWQNGWCSGWVRA